MPVRLTVREVRDALMWGDPPGDGEASSAEIGRLFHEAFAGLVAEARASGRFGTAGEVARRAYDQTVGPYLTGREGSLQASSAEVVRLWRALGALGEWLASIEPTSAAIDAEQAIVAELREPSWTDSVVLGGVADAVVHDRQTGRWCVVELKLGRSRPRADLAQAALYQMIREAADPGGSGHALALLHFGPERAERLVRSEDLAEARPALLDLIGRLAGVLPDPPGPEPTDLGDLLIAVLAEYGIPVEPAGPPILGHVRVQYRVNPGPGVKVSALEQRTRELQVRLGLDSEPVIGIDDGAVTIDLPRRPPQAALFGSIRAELPRGTATVGNSRLPVGVGMDGRLVLADLADPNSAHWLVAGTTGSGKSEWLRAALAGLIATNTPETLQLVLIDPKRNAFGWLRESPFLARPLVFPDETDVEGILDGLLDEMQMRDRLRSETQTDDLAGYVRETGDVLPRIVCVCDELPDLLLGDPAGRKRLEQRFQRLGARARAAGIHLILAAQQPSREVLKGPIVANLGARVGLRMPSPIESRMLLGDGGAERLFGRGDLLFKTVGEPVRLQGLYLSPEERDAIGRGP